MRGSSSENSFSSLAASLGCSTNASDQSCSDPITIDEFPAIFRKIFSLENKAMLTEFNKFIADDFVQTNEILTLKTVLDELDILAGLTLESKYLLMHILMRFKLECTFDVAFEYKNMWKVQRTGASYKYKNLNLATVADTHMIPYLDTVITYLIENCGFSLIKEPVQVYLTITNNEPENYKNSGDDPNYYSKTHLAALLCDQLKIIADRATEQCQNAEVKTEEALYSGERKEQKSDDPVSQEEDSCSFSWISCLGLMGSELDNLNKIMINRINNFNSAVDEYISKREAGDYTDYLCCVTLFAQKSKPYKLVAANLIKKLAKKTETSLNEVTYVTSNEMDVLMRPICPDGQNFSDLPPGKRESLLSTVMKAMTAGIWSRLAKHAQKILADPTHSPQEMLDDEDDILSYRFNINSEFIKPQDIMNSTHSMPSG